LADQTRPFRLSGFTAMRPVRQRTPGVNAGPRRAKRRLRRHPDGGTDSFFVNGSRHAQGRDKTRRTDRRLAVVRSKSGKSFHRKPE
jgi:hypothetical protein